MNLSDFIGGLILATFFLVLFLWGCGIVDVNEILQTL